MTKIILKILSSFLIFVLIFSLQLNFSSAKNQGAQPQEEFNNSNPKKLAYVPGEILVKFREKVNPNKDKSLNELGQDFSNESWQPVFKGETSQKLNIYKKKVTAGAEVKAIQKLSKHPQVEYVELNQMIYTEMVPDDPYYSSSGSWGQSFDDLWGIKKLQPESAWDLAQGEGTTVAVVDTGADYNHEDLAANIWQNSGEIGLDTNGSDKRTNNIDDDNNSFIDDWHGWDTTTIITKPQGWTYTVVGTKEPDNDPMDDNGHGTHVSGTIAAIGNNNLGVIGVAPEAKIMPVKFLTQDGVGTNSDAANALVYAAENGAKIINNSWGGSYSHLIQDAIRYAYNSGVILIASAGNDNSDNFLDHAPSAFPEVISVAATDNTDAKASFSSFGKVDVAAPGQDILSTKSFLDTLESSSYYPIVGENYRVYSGTSMASPHVAGLVALILSQNPNLTNEEVRQVLAKSADDLGTTGFDQYFGFGRIDAQKALTESSRGQAVILAPVGHIDGTDVNILGTAQAANFQEYQLEYGAGDAPQTWIEIARSTIPKTNELLGTWNTEGLTFGHYAIRLKVINTNGDTFENIVRVDFGTPLEILNPTTSVFSPTETIISWNTNHISYSWVEYGKDASYGKTAYSDSEIDVDFAVQLLDLEPNTTYHYRIVADEFAKQISSPDYTFVTPTAVFSIQNVNVAPEPHKITISWETDVPTTGLVQYNRTYWGRELYYQYRNEVTDTNLSTSHTVVLDNIIDDNMEYIYIIKSQDQSGNGATTSPAFFATPRGQYPQVTNFVSQNLTENSLDLVWDTDIPATSEITIRGANEVAYYSTIQQNDNNLAQHHEQTLTGLKSSTTYWLTIVSISADGSRFYFNPASFKTPESSHITNLVIQPSDKTATISWTTDIPTYGKIWYQVGPLEMYDYPTSYTSWYLQTDHSITLTNLSPETLYGFKIESFDNNGNDFLLDVREFTTIASPRDDQAPSGSIKINNDALYTNQSGVTLNLSASDNIGVTEMQFSTDGVVFDLWEPYFTTKNWEFGAGDGSKTIYIRFRDAAGNISPTYSDTIILDISPPQVSAPQTSSPTEDQTPTWTWPPATDNLSGLTDACKFYLGTTSGGSEIVNGAEVSGQNYTYPQNLPFGKYYTYLTCQDNASNIGSSSVSMVEIKDLTKPTGSVIINDSAVYSTSATVTLALSAIDNIGVTEMQFCTDEGYICYSELLWEPYLTTKQWTFNSGDGGKTIYVRFRDAAGNISNTYSDFIIIDTTAPTGSILINNGAVSTKTRKVTLNLSVSDNLGGTVQMRFSNDNINWTVWENFKITKSWVLTTGKGIKTVYVQYHDAAGNISTIYSDLIKY